MNEFSILIGGKAGFGIDRAGMIIASLLNRLGYRIYIYRDYPSLIRGGHTFSIIRASKERIFAHSDKIDIILALDQTTLDLHKGRLKKECYFIFDSEKVKVASGACGMGLPLGELLKADKAPEIMRNTCIIGVFANAVGINFDILKDVIKSELTKDTDLNILVAKRGFDSAKEMIKIEDLKQKELPLLTGNQAVALGLIKGGLDAYISYPMTPSSPILHYLAEIAEHFALDVIHPESEIGVILMALGYSYAGKKSAVATSGGGFCLMTEGLSLSGMAELPLVIVLGQRPGPSTGLPTYSGQADLLFALNAGHGEFVRLLVAPADTEEAYYWSAAAMNISWKYQIPSIILSDKNLGEGVFNFDIKAAGEIKEENALRWGGKSVYQRYALTEDGVSPLAFPSDKGAVVKINSYEHDEAGLTTENPRQATIMQDKRLRKEGSLARDLEKMETLKVHANANSETALLCWGSNKGVCIEVAERLGLKVIQPVLLRPFPKDKFRQALSGVKKLICVESNATGQLARIIAGYGFNADEKILKYDGRPFSIEELEGLIKGACE